MKIEPPPAMAWGIAAPPSHVGVDGLDAHMRGHEGPWMDRDLAGTFPMVLATGSRNCDN